MLSPWTKHCILQCPKGQATSPTSFCSMSTVFNELHAAAAGESQQPCVQKYRPKDPGGRRLPAHQLCRAPPPAGGNLRGLVVPASGAPPSPCLQPPNPPSRWHSRVPSLLDPAGGLLLVSYLLISPQIHRSYPDLWQPISVSDCHRPPLNTIMLYPAHPASRLLDHNDDC